MSSVEYFSKRFKEATAGRKWPNRNLLKLDKKISNLNNQTDSLSEIQQQSMDLWIEERQQLEERVFVDA